MELNNNNEIWDEHRWESHINEVEQKNNQWRVFLEKTIGDDSPRWYRILKQSKSEHDALDTYIEEELLFDETYFPDEDDDWEEEDDDDIIFEDDEDLQEYLGLEDNDEDDYDDDLLDESMDFLEEGEEWKMDSVEYAATNYGIIENLSIYLQAHDLGLLVLKMAEEHHELHLNPTYNQFVYDVLQTSTKITSGYSLGYEIDMLGGNIAYTKKALDAANNALNSLQAIKNKDIFPVSQTYFTLHKSLSKLRNEIGVYLQELRIRFREEMK